MRASTIVLAAALVLPAFAHARRSAPTPAALAEPAVAELRNRTFDITVQRGGKEFSGTLQIGQLAAEHATAGNSALNATIHVPASAVNEFYGYTGGIANFFSRFETSGGEYVLGAFVFVGQSTPQRTPNAVSIVIGSPQPGSLSGGAGIDTLQGSLQPDGSVTGDGTAVSGYPDAFFATPTP